MRNITFISDTHGVHEELDGKLKGGWMLIHCGDISGWGKSKEIRQFLKWFGRQPYEHRIFIAGNHDEALSTHVIKHFNLPDGVVYLQDSSVTVDGIKIWGSPYTPTYGHYWFMRDRGDDMKRKWMFIPADTDILITHGPPDGIMDWANIYDAKRTLVGRAHKGCEELAKRVDDIKPSIHAFGHIHECYGSETHDGVLYINSSSICNGEAVSREPIIVDYNILGVL